MGSLHSLSSDKRVPAAKSSAWLLGLAFILWLGAGGLAVYRQVHEGSADFREFWEVTRLTVHGLGESRHKVPFTYPPLFHVLLGAFSILPLLPAAALWYVFCSACALTSFWILRRLCRDAGRPLPTRWLLVPILMSLGLAVNDLLMGNANLVVLLCITAMLLLVARGRDYWAGLALAAGAALKILPAIFLFYFLYKRQYKVVFGAVAGLVLLIYVLPISVLGIDRGNTLISGWARQVIPVSIQAGEGSRWYEADSINRGTNQSMAAVLHRFLRPIPSIRGTKPMGTVNVANVPEQAIQILHAMLAVCLLAACVFLMRLPQRPERNIVSLLLEAGLVLVAMLLLSKVTWVNYFIHLAVAQFALVLFVQTRDPASREVRFIRRCLLASFVLSTAGGSAVLQAYAFPMLGGLVLALGLMKALRIELRETIK